MFDNKFMQKLLKLITVLLLMINMSSFSLADCDEITEDRSWDMIYTGTVTGYRDTDGKTGDDFEGCDFGRDLILDYSKKVTCNSYNYSYSYMPTIQVYSNGYSLKACIDNDMYDVSR